MFSALYFFALRWNAFQYLDPSLDLKCSLDACGQKFAITREDGDEIEVSGAQHEGKWELNKLNDSL